MKKVIFSLALLLTGVGTWAQTTATPLTAAELNAIPGSLKIAIQSANADLTTFYFGTDGLTPWPATNDNANLIFEWVRVEGESTFYVKKINADEDVAYMGKNTNNKVVFGTKNDAVKVTATTLSDTETQKHRITDSNSKRHLRVGGNHDFTDATGGWTQQKIYSVAKITINNDGTETVEYNLEPERKIYKKAGYTLTVTDAEGTEIAFEGDYYLANNENDITVTYTLENPAAAALASLQETLDAADAIAWGTAVGYYEKTEDIANAIKAAQNLVTEESTDVDALEKANNALKEAIDNLPVIMPEAGKFYTFVGSSGNYMTGQTSTSNTARAKMCPCPESGYDASYVVYYTGSKLVSFSTGLGLSSAAKFANIGDAASDVTFVNTYGAHTAVAGKLCVMIGTQNIHDWSVGDASENNHTGINGNFDSSSDWTISEVTTLPLAISDAGYASFYAPVAVTMPAGLEAYAVESVSGDAAMLKAVEGVVPANTGVILKGDAGDYELNITESNAVAETLLKGSVASEYVDADAYVLATKDDVVGLYKAKKTVSTDTTNDGEEGTEDDTFESFVNNGFKAYLPAEGAASARLLFDFGTETAIESIQGAESANAVVYDLAGRRVQNAQKGLYIVNGKKVVK